MSEWTWARSSDQEVWMNGVFDSKEAAIGEGRAILKEEQETFKLEELDHFYVGRCEEYVPSPPDADEVLEETADRMLDVFEKEVVDSAIYEISVGDTRLLQNKLEKAWNSWLEEIDWDFDAFLVVDIERVELEGSEDG